VQRQLLINTLMWCEHGLSTVHVCSTVVQRRATRNVDSFIFTSVRRHRVTIKQINVPTTTRVSNSGQQQLYFYRFILEKFNRYETNGRGKGEFRRLNMFGGTNGPETHERIVFTSALQLSCDVADCSMFILVCYPSIHGRLFAGCSFYQ
jgi:hypothetical protein